VNAFIDVRLDAVDANGDPNGSDVVFGNEVPLHVENVHENTPLMNERSCEPPASPMMYVPPADTHDRMAARIVVDNAPITDDPSCSGTTTTVAPGGAHPEADVIDVNVLGVMPTVVSTPRMMVASEETLVPTPVYDGL
jgi:hypothetical protein